MPVTSSRASRGKRPRRPPKPARSRCESSTEELRVERRDVVIVARGDRPLAIAATYGLRLPKRFEGRSHFRREELRLFPRGEVPALLQPVVVDELWVRSFCPTLGRRVDL